MGKFDDEMRVLDKTGVIVFIILSIIVALTLVGCSVKTVCQGWGKLECPKPTTELEASWFYPPLGLITEKITTCVSSSELNVSSSEFDEFACKELP